ncbi:MAG TPA: hypothetical protein PLB30_05345 [Thermoleophilia bacterium]|nr:hypothetical protein [Thermoleophilia bacterium]HQG03898.1 hypothetical protein [Thermoleophilia bacterium]HQG54802.1 hypothetical protein [Thermoleophilia bacterium]HQJ97960.1 hypothetical protein [Thermoleophilia bacterium]
MNGSVGDVPPYLDVKGSFRELQVTAFVGRFKVVGVASFGVGLRASSRRPSDFLRSVDDSRLTLADASIHDARSGDLLDSAPFVVLNLDKVDVLYARDDVSAPATRGQEAGGSAVEPLGDRVGGDAAESRDGPAGSA